jgi:hypothetical protein
MPKRNPLNPASIDIDIIPPLPNNTTLEIVDDLNVVVGYVFSCAGAAGATLEQRWVLYEGFALSPPAMLRLPEDEARRYTELADWQRAIVTGSDGPLWQAGATYVKVNATHHLKRVDPEADAPPFPSLRVSPRTPRKRVKPLQMVDMELGVSQDEIHISNVYGTRLTPIGTTGLQGNREYWVTRRAPVVGVPILLAKGNAEPRNVQAFLDATFTEGSTLVIASCTYLQALPDNP